MYEQKTSTTCRHNRRKSHRGRFFHGSVHQVSRLATDSVKQQIFRDTRNTSMGEQRIMVPRIYMYIYICIYIHVCIINTCNSQYCKVYLGLFLEVCSMSCCCGCRCTPKPTRAGFRRVVIIKCSISLLNIIIIIIHFLVLVLLLLFIIVIRVMVVVRFCCLFSSAMNKHKLSNDLYSTAVDDDAVTTLVGEVFGRNRRAHQRSSLNVTLLVNNIIGILIHQCQYCYRR